jgi:hypothetical protein
MLNIVQSPEKLQKKLRSNTTADLRGRTHNKIKAKWNIIKRGTVTVHSVEQVPILLVNDEKLKDPTNLTNAFNNVFITITEKIKHLTNTERRHCLTVGRSIS